MFINYMKLVQQIVKPYISGLHLGSYTYLLSHILDHTISKKETLELIQKNPEQIIVEPNSHHASATETSKTMHCQTSQPRYRT